MAESKLAVVSMDFAVKILKLCDGIKGHYSIVNQLERSATSVGANIREANYAHSKADFVSKLQISLKECYETEYWLELMLKAGILNDYVAKDLLHECGSIRRMLVSSVNTIKNKEKTLENSILFVFVSVRAQHRLQVYLQHHLTAGQLRFACLHTQFQGIIKYYLLTLF